MYADKKYHISTNKYTFNHKKAQDLLELRNKEWQDVKEYINTADCKMSFLQKETGLWPNETTRHRIKQWRGRP